MDNSFAGIAAAMSHDRGAGAARRHVRGPPISCIGNSGSRRQGENPESRVFGGKADQMQRKIVLRGAHRSAGCIRSRIG